MFKTKNETGQSLVLIAVMIFGLFVLAGLIVDGGNMYLNRRQAQTAADAAALAAALEYCINKGSLADADLVAQDYALEENQATQMIDLSPADNPDGIAPFILIDADSKNVKVAVELEHSTFFARVFGQDATIVEATASAGCYPPAAADSVIPVAWTCRPPLPGVESTSDDCDYKSIPWGVMKEILDDLMAEIPGCPQNNRRLCLTGKAPLLYYDSQTIAPEDVTREDVVFEPVYPEQVLQLNIIMDALPLGADVYCTTDSGQLASFCDLDGDGRIDWTNSERSWLLLDKDSNQAQLDDIVRGDITFGMFTPGWYPGRGGNIADVYHDAESFVEGTPALIPVFEWGMICGSSVDPRLDCELADENDHVMKLAGNDPETYFYVIGFAEFYVSCVADSPSKVCPGKEEVIAKLTDAGLSTMAKDFKNEFSIEGYFLNGWVADNPELQTGENQIDLGIYIITLTE